MDIYCYIQIPPNQTANDFNDFRLRLNSIHTRSESWWSDVITTYEESHIESLTTTHGLYQLPRSSSCIDLFFTDQPNLATDFGVHVSLHTDCLHPIAYCKGEWSGGGGVVGGFIGLQDYGIGYIFHTGIREIFVRDIRI